MTIPFHTFRAADGHLFLAPLVAIWTAWMVGWIADLIGALSVDDYILNRTPLSGPIKFLVGYGGPVTVTVIALAEMLYLRRTFGATLRGGSLLPTVARNYA